MQYNYLYHVTFEKKYCKAYEILQDMFYHCNCISTTSHVGSSLTLVT